MAVDQSCAVHFNKLRFDDDLTGLHKDLSGGALGRWQYIQLGDDADQYLSFGGEMRQRYEYTHHPMFGTDRQDKRGVWVQRIALRDGIDQHVVARTIRLAFLAPDITKAILAGNEPRGLTSQTLVRIPTLPSDRNAQREVLGFI